MTDSEATRPESLLLVVFRSRQQSDSSRGRPSGPGGGMDCGEPGAGPHMMMLTAQFVGGGLP